MPLTILAITKAKAAGKTVRMYDGGGLYLEISPAGGKWWRWKYRFDRKENRLSFGTFPDVSLAEAREKRDAARKLLASGVNPGQQRKAAKDANGRALRDSFEAVAREWHKKQESVWAESHSSRILLRLKNDIFPWLGNLPISSIRATHVLDAVNRVVDRGAVESAHRILQNCAQIFRYAVATARVDRNPIADLRGALPPVRPTHLAAITDPRSIGGLLRAIDSYNGTFVTKCALRLAPLVFVRPGELRHAEWSEFDLERAEWNIPAGKMKTRQPHLVPLAPQALAILEDLRSLTGTGRYVFPSARTNTRPMSNNAVLSALRRMGFATDEMSGHGFRAMARTVLDEILKVRPEFIEHQLAHMVRDPNGRAYNRTAHIEERRQMMSTWANYLDDLKCAPQKP